MTTSNGSSSIRLINDIPGTPPAVGPYSQLAIAGDMYFLSGQLPLDPATGKLVEGGIERQTSQVFDNIQAVLHAEDLGLEHIVRCSVYLTDWDTFAEMNSIYAKRFNGHQPARETIGVHALALGASIEITVIAHRSQS